MAELENIDVSSDVQNEPQIQNESQPSTDKTKVLYDALSPKYKLGTYDEFSKKLQDPTKTIINNTLKFSNLTFYKNPLKQNNYYLNFN